MTAKFKQLIQDSDFVTGLVTFILANIAEQGAGHDVKDWIFPLMAAHTLYACSLFFLFKSAIKFFRNNLETDLNPGELRPIKDVTVFSVFVFIYLFIMYYLGFYVASLLLIWASIVFFTEEVDIRIIGKALLTAIIACIVAYVVFTHIFYVPFPKSHLL
jgi:hypothetical protein